MNKKAIELSVNAIVVIIIAVVILGLALSLVGMLFGGAAEKFQGLLDEEQDPSIPTPSGPLTLSRQLITANPGEDQALKLSLYNPTNAAWGSVKPSIVCSPTAFNVQTNSKKIEQGKYVTFGAVITIPGTETEGTHLCEVSFKDGTQALPYLADFAIEVKYG